MAKMYRSVIYGLFGEMVNIDPRSQNMVNLSQTVSDAITKNLREPIRSGSDKFKNIYGTADEQLEAYKNFTEEYKYALKNELKNNSHLLSTERKKQILNALRNDNASVNLSLVSNIRERTRLNSVFNRDVIKVDRLIQEYGLPGIMLPSSNVNRFAARFLVSTEGEYSPIGNILQRATFSIDAARQTAARGGIDVSAIKIGTSNLPSYEDVITGANQPTQMSTAMAGKKIYFLDTETTGVSNLDIVRSVSVQEGTFGPNGISMFGDDLGARFDTAQFSEFVAADPNDLSRTTNLSDAVITKETPPGLTKRFDITTDLGRNQARDFYTDLLTKLSQDDAYIGAYNGQFDVDMLVKSARSVGVSETLIDKIESRARTGGLIDILGGVRNRLGNELVKHVENLPSGMSPEDRALEAQRFVFSDRALMRGLRLGEKSVSPFGLENIIESTNFLELMAEKAQAGDTAAEELLQKLSQGAFSHTDYVDRVVAAQVAGVTDQLTSRRNYNASGLSNRYIKMNRMARLYTESSRAVVPTANLSDPRYLTDTALRYVTETDAIKNVQLDVNLSQIGMQHDEFARLRYNSQVGAFQLIRTNAQTINIADSQAEDLIKKEIGRIRSLSFDAPLSSQTYDNAVINTLGINPIELRNVEATAKTITEMRQAGGITTLTDIGRADDRAIINALTAFRQHVGFNYMAVSPDESQIRTLMRGQNDVISDESRASYQSAVRLMGVGAASMDPTLRSMFVSASSLTSGLTAENDKYFASILNADVNDDIFKGFMENTIKGNTKLLSELEIFTARTIERSFTARTGTFFATTDMLDQIMVDINGQQVSLRQRIQSGTSRLSVATPSSGTKVNIIYGGEAIREGLSPSDALASIKEAEREADAIFDYQRQRILSGQIANTDIIANFGVDDADLLEAKNSFRERYVRSGLAYGTVKEGEGAEELAKVINQATESDLPNVQRKFIYRAADINEDFVTALPDTPVEVLRTAEDLMGETIDPFASRQQLIANVIQRAKDSPSFIKDLNKTVRTTRGKSGRTLRDQEIFDKVAKIKPKVYAGVAAVAAAGAGYYLARKKQEKNLVDEVMAPQPIETNPGPMTIQEFNQVDQQMASVSSSRRDPLTTAGVVGNLDRNKISHYKMGPKKYDHLYSR